jgi:hypothetical protein
MKSTKNNYILIMLFTICSASLNLKLGNNVCMICICLKHMKVKQTKFSVLCDAHLLKVIMFISTALSLSLILFHEEELAAFIYKTLFKVYK